MKITKPNQVIKMLDSIYDNALQGLPGLETVEELANEYLADNDTVEEAINSLIQWQIAKCAATGFVAGLPGPFLLPITVPADITVNYYIQIRMISAIAYMRGYDINNDKLKTFIYLSLLGDAGKDILKNFGIEVGRSLTKKVIQAIPGKILTKINQAIGKRLLTKFGDKGVLNLKKFIPVAGGFIGGAADGYYCNAVGDQAKIIFKTKNAA